MSYILDALKRAESERDSGAVPTLNTPLPSRADELWADGVKVVICGHVHERWAERTMLCGLRVINVGVDVRNYRPVTFDDIGVDPDLLEPPRTA